MPDPAEVSQHYRYQQAGLESLPEQRDESA
jgi:hypothetical protein